MTDNFRGILAILASSAGFVVNDAIVKVVSAELPNSQIIVIRGVMATLILGTAMFMTRGWRSPRVLLTPPMLVRLIASAFATLFIVAALRHLPLASVSAILQVTPLAVTAGAALMLGSHVGWQRWTASIVGLAGVMLIIKPGTASFVPEAWIAMVAVVFTATRDLATRFVDHAVPSLLIAAASSLMVTIGGLCLMPFEVWVAPSHKSLLLLAGASSALYFAYYFGVVGMRVGEIPVVAPFRYSLVLLALLLGYLIWGHVPDALSFAGIAVVVLAGLYLLHREQAVARAARRQAQLAQRSAT